MGGEGQAPEGRKSGARAWVREMGWPRTDAGILSSLTGLALLFPKLPTDESVGYFRVSPRDWGGAAFGTRARRRYVQSGTSENSPPFQRWEPRVGEGQTLEGKWRLHSA